MSETPTAVTEPAEPADQPEQSAPQPAAGADAPRRYSAGGFNTLYWNYFGLAIGGVLLSITVIGVLIGFPALVASAVCAAIFLYRSWDQVQDSEARATPGLAVGLMFVPLFNLYWAYIAIWGLSKNLNSYTRRNNIEAPKVNEGLALGLCVMMSVGLIFMFIPFLNILAWLVTIPLALVVMNDFRKASMAIANT